MNLEEELREVLSQEAELRTTPSPDIDRMVNGGQDRLRRRTTMRIGIAAAAVLLIGGGVYGAAQIGDDSDADSGVTTLPTEPTEPTESTATAAGPPNWVDTNGGPVAGTYRAYVGTGADGHNIEADLTVHGSNWTASNYPVAYDGQHFAGIGVYRPWSVAGGCKMDAGFEPAAAEPQSLAQQLAGMPRSDILQQPAPTNALGHRAVHLRLRVDAACNGAAAYLVADTAAGSRGISYFDNSPENGVVIIDFWVMDVDGTTVIVDMFHTEDAPSRLVDQATAARESIAFVTGE